MKAVSVRILHRYLGFFLAGIMFVYSLSGIVLIYRDTDDFKVSQYVEKTISLNLHRFELGKELRIKNFKVDNETDELVYFKNGTYNKLNGEVKYTKMELPYLLGKLTHLHKATTNSPAYWLNIFFGVSLLFFTLSSFWMFKPKSKTFKLGIRYSVGGVALTLLLLFI
ncbi:MAG: hypothetical protein COA59_16460 [Colwellia sp.]|nr:MAG: hypothetical protein COA59_16460 [Colwellia sp.]